MTSSKLTETSQVLNYIVTTKIELCRQNSSSNNMTADLDIKSNVNRSTLKAPMVSVCMAMYNASRYLRECIDSILAQTFTDFELLIVDDGSTDDSKEIVRSYEDQRIRLI